MNLSWIDLITVTSGLQNVHGLKVKVKKENNFILHILNIFTYFGHTENSGNDDIFSFGINKKITISYSFSFFFWPVNCASLVYNLHAAFGTSQNTRTLFITECIWYWQM